MSLLGVRSSSRVPPGLLASQCGYTSRRAQGRLREPLENLKRADGVIITHAIATDELIEANVERCGELVEQSLAMCTSLAPEIGYDKAAAVAKEAFRTGKTVRQVAIEMGVLDEERLQKVLDPASMTEPH